MRTYKFRMWDLQEKCFMNHSRVIESRLLSLENNGEGRFVFQQWIGLLDTQGKEIYEGDIAENPFGEHFEIRWDKKGCRFIAVTTIEDGSEWYQNVSSNLKVIGNIYENQNSTK
ncbi:YopX family protein [Bacillus pseudomycoides]|uniref:YopX family protein n=1 Tax=Bacillus bingmayongensis TaxID=1150157 RepID=A0ABU5JXP4_9BACI|nr:YopX family protein [Bacillus pseudomycoides]